MIWLCPPLLSLHKHHSTHRHSRCVRECPPFYLPFVSFQRLSFTCLLPVTRAHTPREQAPLTFASGTQVARRGFCVDWVKQRLQLLAAVGERNYDFLAPSRMTLSKCCLAYVRITNNAWFKHLPPGQERWLSSYEH